MADFPEQLNEVHQVAAKFWDCDLDALGDVLPKIEVVKRNGGKIMGTLPEFNDHPEVFYKVYFYDRGFAFESAGLRAANAMPPVEGVTVPKLVAIYPAYRAILTEKEDWEENRSGLQRFFVRSLGIDWFKVGQWLRTFHDSQVSHESNDYFLRKKFEKIQTHVNDLQTLFTADQVKKMQGIIAMAREYFASAEMDWVISHGDFGLANIQKRGETLTIIDFEDCQFAPRAFDILNCLGRLEYSKYFPNSQGTYQKIKDEFLQGYGTQEFSETAVYNFFFLLIQLDIIETYFRRRQLGKYQFYQKAVFGWFEDITVRKLGAWLNT